MDEKWMPFVSWKREKNDKVPFWWLIMTITLICKNLQVYGERGVATPIDIDVRTVSPLLKQMCSCCHAVGSFNAE